MPNANQLHVKLRLLSQEGGYLWMMPIVYATLFIPNQGFLRRRRVRYEKEE
jgi:hypothetical protein